MKRYFLLPVLLVFTSLIAWSCDFYFEAESKIVKLQESFYVKVTIVQTHNRCTLTSMEDYHFDTKNVTILSKTAWKEVKPDVFEAWVKLESTQSGDGWIKIYKNCTKEGYQEEVFYFDII
jgi:hypothetical protein